jgi:uncharacterized protein YndB with AHSA1/START domain
MARVYVSSVISAPIEQVWDYLRDFNNLPKWFPGVTDSKIEAAMRADQVGCVRNFGLQGGQRMREQLLALSDVNHSWTYKMLEGPMPISNYVPTFRLWPITDRNRTFVEGAVRFDCAKEQEGEFTAFFAKAYQTAFDNLKRHLGDSKGATA